MVCLIRYEHNDNKSIETKTFFRSQCSYYKDIHKLNYCHHLQVFYLIKYPSFNEYRPLMNTVCFSPLCYLYPHHIHCLLSFRCKKSNSIHSSLIHPLFYVSSIKQ